MSENRIGFGWTWIPQLWKVAQNISFFHTLWGEGDVVAEEISITLFNLPGCKADQNGTTQTWCWLPGGIYPSFAVNCSSFKLLSRNRKLVRNGLCFSRQTLWSVEGSFVRFSWRHGPFTSTLTEAPEFTTPSGQGFFFFLCMCKGIQMRKWTGLEFIRFWLYNFGYVNSVLLISDLGMEATALSSCLPVVFSDSSFVPRIGFLHAVCWNSF